MRLSRASTTGMNIKRTFRRGSSSLSMSYIRKVGSVLQPLPRELAALRPLLMAGRCDAVLVGTEEVVPSF